MHGLCQCNAQWSFQALFGHEIEASSRQASSLRLSECNLSDERYVTPLLCEQVGVQLKERGAKNRFAYDVHESLEELGRLASTSGLEVHP